MHGLTITRWGEFRSIEKQFLQSNVLLNGLPVQRFFELKIGMDNTAEHVSELKVQAVSAVARGGLKSSLRALAKPELCL